jgi:purine-binding chemotaxis protein CheW
MSTQGLVMDRPSHEVDGETLSEEVASSDFVTMRVCGQLVGLPILSVQDILAPQKLTTIPLSPPEVAGSLNLRGRIVTAIELRERLGLEPRPEDQPSMNVVVEQHGELYSLIIDAIGDVLSLPDDRFERVPPTLDQTWCSISTGVFRLDDEILVVLECEKVLDFAI